MPIIAMSANSVLINAVEKTPSGALWVRSFSASMYLSLFASTGRRCQRLPSHCMSLAVCHLPTETPVNMTKFPMCILSPLTIPVLAVSAIAVGPL